MPIKILDLNVDGIITPEMFGCSGRGTEDDTEKMRAALDYATQHSKKVVGENTYMLNGLEMKSEDQLSLNRVISNGANHKAFVFRDSKNVYINVNRADVEGTVFYFEPTVNTNSSSPNVILHIEIHVGKVQGHGDTPGHCNKFMHINCKSEIDGTNMYTTGVQNVYVYSNMVFCNNVLKGETQEVSYVNSNNDTVKKEGWFGEICFIGGLYTAHGVNSSGKYTGCAIDIMNGKSTGVRFVCSSLENSDIFLKTNKGLTSFTETRLETHTKWENIEESDRPEGVDTSKEAYVIKASDDASVRIYSYSLNPSKIDVSGLTENGSFVMTASNTHYGSGDSLKADNFPTYMVYDGLRKVWSPSPRASVYYPDVYCTNIYDNGNYTNVSNIIGDYSAPSCIQIGRTWTEEDVTAKKYTFNYDLLKRIHANGNPVTIIIPFDDTKLYYETLDNNGTKVQYQWQSGRSDSGGTFSRGIYMLCPIVSTSVSGYKCITVKGGRSFGFVLCKLSAA